MKRVVLASFIAVFLLVALAISFYYSQRLNVLKVNPLDAVPTDAAFVLQCKNGHDVLHSLDQQTFFKNLCTDSAIAAFRSNMLSLEKIFEKEPELKTLWHEQSFFISAHLTKADDFDYLVLSNTPREVGAKDILALGEKLGASFGKREYEDVVIYEQQFGGRTGFAFAVSQGLLIFSHTSFLVEDAIRQLSAGASIRKIKAFTKVAVSKPSAPVTMYVNYLGLHDLLSGFSSIDHHAALNMTGNFARWSSAELTWSSDQVISEGKIASVDTSDFIHAFINAHPLRSSLAYCLPEQTAFYFSMKSDDMKSVLSHLASDATIFKSFNQRKDRMDSLQRRYKVNVNESMLKILGSEIICAYTEPGSTVFNNNLLAYIRVQNPNNALATLDDLKHGLNRNGPSTKYKGYPIVELSPFNVLADVYGNYFEDFSRNYYTSIRDYIVFANQPAILRSLVDAIEAGKILAKDSLYRATSRSMAIDENISLYLDFRKSINFLKAHSSQRFLEILPTRWKIWISGPEKRSCRKPSWRHVGE